MSLDYISEAFAVTHEIKTLVKDLLAAELWREKVVPIMIKTKDRIHSKSHFFKK